MRVVVKQVVTSAQQREFVAFAQWLYRGDSRWVAPLKGSIDAMFSAQSNPLLERGDARRWLAYNAHGECVGRIAAFYSAPADNREELRVAGCGFFESIDSVKAATLLFDAAREWLASMGFNAMDGPINFGSRQAWWGLLTKGFEFVPLFENNYNPPYYRALFEGYGFRNYYNQYTYRWRVGHESVNPMVDRRGERLLGRGDYSVRSITRGEVSLASEWFREIYNRAWIRFPGAEPMSQAQCGALFASMRPIIDCDLIIFAFYRGEPIGFFVMIPDLNRVIGDFNGRFNLWQKMLLWWRLRIIKSCDRLFGVVFGIAPEHQGRGVESIIIRQLRDGYILTPKNRCYATLELAWVGEFNPVMSRMIEGYVGAVCHKEHTTYRYIFDPSIPFKRHEIIERR